MFLKILSQFSGYLFNYGGGRIRGSPDIRISDHLGPDNIFFQKKIERWNYCTLGLMYFEGYLAGVPAMIGLLNRLQN